MEIYRDNSDMAQRRGRKHQFEIDGQSVWLDSLTEQQALINLIDKHGFSGKWLRPRFGIKHAGKFYSPDFELAVDDYGNTARALLEVKQYRKDFTKTMAERMCAVARHYHSKQLYLYAAKSGKWYKILSPKAIRECRPPLPGKLPLSELLQPKRMVVKNYHGRRYYQSLSDKLLSFFR